ncbi:MAG: DNA repair protein RadC [Bacteroidia bacterium]|nr:DNA repair protein RadC [Bacteroidia bacterium]
MTELSQLTNDELLAIIAPSIRLDGRTLKDVAITPITDLHKSGVTMQSAKRIKAAFELGYRYLSQCKTAGETINSPEDVARIFIPKLRPLDHEEFHVVMLSNSGRIIEDFTVSKGILNASLIHPREVYKRAVLLSAASVILVHNHPSGIREASKEDHHITKQLVSAGKMMDIPVQDHVIVCGESYISFAESGWL